MELVSYGLEYTNGVSELWLRVHKSLQFEKSCRQGENASYWFAWEIQRIPKLRNVNSLSALIPSILLTITTYLPHLPPPPTFKLSFPYLLYLLHTFESFWGGRKVDLWRPLPPAMKVWNFSFLIQKPAFRKVQMFRLPIPSRWLGCMGRPTVIDCD
jgi:hypothetical protein